MAPAAGQDAAHRPGAGPVDRGRRAQGQHRQHQALAAMIENCVLALDSAHACHESPRCPRCCRSTASRLASRRGHQFCFAVLAAANGEEGIVPWQRVVAVGCVSSERSKPLYNLFPPDVRAGDQPADRPDLRGHRDEPRSFVGPAQPAGHQPGRNPPMRLSRTSPSWTSRAWPPPDRAVSRIASLRARHYT